MNSFHSTLRAIATAAFLWVVLPSHAADPWIPCFPELPEQGEPDIVIVITGV